MNQGDGILTFNVTGTPNVGGTISFVIEVLGQTCTVDITGDDENTVNINFLADYIVLSYTFQKPGQGEPADTWILDDGTDFYNTPYTVPGQPTKLVKNDVQGDDLDTHTRIYAGPDENNPVISSQYFGFSAIDGPYPALTTTGAANGMLVNNSGNGVIPLTDQAIFRWGNDNTGTGSETVLINVKEFLRRFGPGGTNVGTNSATQIPTPITTFNVEMRAWWHTTGLPTRYPVKMKAEFYKETPTNPITGVTCQNFKFIVAGGETTTVLTPPVIVINDLTLANLQNDLYFNQSGDETANPPKSKRINVFTYSAITGSGAFVNDNTSLNRLNQNRPINI